MSEEFTVSDVKSCMQRIDPWLSTSDAAFLNGLMQKYPKGIKALSTKNKRFVAEFFTSYLNKSIEKNNSDGALERVIEILFGRSVVGSIDLATNNLSVMRRGSKITLLCDDEAIGSAG